MITKNQYIEYLLSTPPDYICTNLQANLEGIGAMPRAISGVIHILRRKPELTLN